ncbi:MAG: hypothetical protein ABSG53_02670 [Thermoguttaceae bacterium]
MSIRSDYHSCIHRAESSQGARWATTNRLVARRPAANRPEQVSLWDPSAMMSRNPLATLRQWKEPCR